MQIRIYRNGANSDYIEHRRPTRSPSFEADGLVPVINGLAGAFFGGPFLALLIDKFSTHTWSEVILMTMFGCGVLIFSAARFDTLASMWEVTIEPLIHADPVDVPVVEVPKPEERVVIAQPYQPTRRLPGPGDAEWQAMTELEAFVRGCAITTAMSHWEPKIGRAKYQQMRDTLIRLGAASWHDPNAQKQGWKLTGDPDDIIEQVFAG
jgi:hypothetical protein